MVRRFAPVGVLLVLAVAAIVYYGFFIPQTPPQYRYGSVGSSIEFNDTPQTNSELPADFATFNFVDVDGNTIKLADFQGSRNVVVVITRGNTGVPCPYCTTQTSRLITNYDEFKSRSAEIVVVYPLESMDDEGAYQTFLAATRKKLASSRTSIPFPIALDVELNAVDRLGIRDFLSKPATYILDQDGQLRFAYVGSGMSDRPSVKAMLNQLDALNQE